MYDKNFPVIGVTGKPHLSAAEAKASFHLARFGIVPCDDYYPVTFQDPKAVSFNARSDFIHKASAVWFEFKCSRLNGLKTKANAAKAEARFQEREARGYINNRNRQSEILKASWSNSIEKQSAVINTLTPAKVVLILKDEPDEKEARRLEKKGIFYRSMKTISVFAFFLKLAFLGLDVGFQTSTHAFSVAVTEG
jgi:hypothetical protein